MNIEKNYIYVLYDPREPDNYRYCGFTNNIKRRFKAHLYDVKYYNNHKELKKFYKIKWLELLSKENIKPEIKIICEFFCDKEFIKLKELYYCNKFLNDGHKLTNSAPPGFGGSPGHKIPKKLLDKLIDINSKIVYQYGIVDNKYVKYIKNFKSLTDASNKTTVKISCISKSCKYHNTAKGYIFSFEKMTENEITEILYKINNPNKSRYKNVYKYDLLNYTCIDEYKSVIDAANINNLNKSAIANCCRGISSIAGNFFWSYNKLSKDEIKELNYKNKKIVNYNKKIVQKDLQGKIIDIFDKIIDASNKTGIKQQHISACCSNKIKKTHNYIFEYKD